MLKQFCSALCLISIIVPSIYAFEGNEKSTAALLLSGDGKKISSAARSIHSSRTQNTDLLDILAELLWQDINQKQTLTNDQSAWLMKAIAASRLKRYANFFRNLENIYAELDKKEERAADTSSDSFDFTQARYYKLRRYISKYLPHLKQGPDGDFIPGSLDLTSIKNQLQTLPVSERLYTDESNIYATLLISGDRRKVELAVRSLFAERSRNTHALDIVAELLLKETKQKSYLSADSLAWMIKAIGVSKHARYKNVFVEVEKNLLALANKYGSSLNDVSDDDAGSVSSEERFTDYGKTLAYLQKWRNQLKDTAYGDFVPGKIDLVSLEQRLESTRLESDSATSVNQLQNIRRRSNIKIVIQQAGLPKTIMVSFVGRRYELDLTYPGAGTVKMTYKKRGGFIVRGIKGDYSDITNKDYKEGLTLKNPDELRIYIKSLYDNNESRQEVLDFAATLAWASLNTEDHRQADNVAWLCKLIGQSKSSRYRSFMKDLYENTTNEKIQKFAEPQIEMISSGNEPQFLAYK